MIQEGEVRAHLRRFVELINDGQIDAAWSTMAEDGSVISLAGMYLQGRAAVVRKTKQDIATFGYIKAEAEIGEFRALNDSVATVIAAWRFKTREETIQARTLSVYQKIAGQIRMVSGATVEQK